MSSRFVSDLDQMRDEWDRRAREDALAAACPEVAGQSEAEFWRSGEALVQARVEPEVEPLRAAAGEEPLLALEIGCGVGRLLRAMARLFDEVHGIDVSAEMLRRAEAALDGIEGIVLHHGDGMTLQCVRRAEFDFVFSHDTLGHLPDPDLLVYILRQAKHRLKDDGLLLFQLEARQFDDDEVTRLVERTGLRLQKSERANKDLWIWARQA